MRCTNLLFLLAFSSISFMTIQPAEQQPTGAEQYTHSAAGYRAWAAKEAIMKSAESLANDIAKRADRRNRKECIALEEKMAKCVQDINSLNNVIRGELESFTSAYDGQEYRSTDTVANLAEALTEMKAELKSLKAKLSDEEDKAATRRVRSEGELAHDVRQIAHAFIDDIAQENKREHDLNVARIKADAEGKASIERMKEALKPRNIMLWGSTAAAVLCTTVIMYFFAKHGIPLLLKRQPSYMQTSIRSFWQRMLKSLPQERSRMNELQFSQEQSQVIEDVFNDYMRCINSNIELTNLLFYGPPGTGKTMTARALSLELGADYILVNSPELSQLPDEEAIQALKYIVELARSWERPVFVFFDEADALFMHRSVAPVKERKMTNELLSLIPDAYEKGVAFIFATNLPDALDPAFKRRIGRKICFELPDQQARTILFTQYLRSFAQSCNLYVAQEVIDAREEIAALLVGMSGSDIAELCHEIRLAALKEESDHISLTLCQSIVTRKLHENSMVNAATYQQLASSTPETPHEQTI